MFISRNVIQTRTQVHARHALITPDGHVPSFHPGLEKARWVVHITPAMGAKFVQSTITLQPGGKVRFPECDSGPESEHVLYVSAGSASFALGGKQIPLAPGSYIYLPARRTAELSAGEVPVTVIWFEKKYAPGPGAKLPPEPLIGQASEVGGQPFMGNPKAVLQVLLPDLPAFDLAVNIFTYQPGAMLPFVETHVMEHGLLMLSGQGVYLLEEKWYPVAAGDIIWMAPYCPQWFVAMGDEPASYLYYKDVNRPLL